MNNEEIIQEYNKQFNKIKKRKKEEERLMSLDNSTLIAECVYKTLKNAGFSDKEINEHYEEHEIIMIPYLKEIKRRMKENVYVYRNRNFENFLRTLFLNYTMICDFEKRDLIECVENAYDVYSYDAASVWEEQDDTGQY